ncbi:hypothetical protein RIR_jg24960.t2 [Rhizophagus irregularis DAOM 181602=DAOM 197198]|nr:hypothetical protein RIR_jg24960.t2 [Rhizophagus irregularis DAOM 181602=DAOM 197198]
MYHVCELRRFSSSAILTRGNKAVLSVFLDANLDDSLNSLWIWDSELPILFENRSECPSLVTYLSDMWDFGDRILKTTDL